MAREMPLEDRARLRHARLGGEALGVRCDHPVDHLEVFEPHRGEPQAPTFLAATSSSIRVARLPMTKYCAAGALPSFTSCVQASTGTLMPNALSMAKTMSR